MFSCSPYSPTLCSEGSMGKSYQSALPSPDTDVRPGVQHMPGWALATCWAPTTPPKGTVRARGGRAQRGTQRGTQRGAPVGCAHTVPHPGKGPGPQRMLNFPAPLVAGWLSRHHRSLRRGSLPGRFRACSGVSPRISSPPSSSGY